MDNKMDNDNLTIIQKVARIRSTPFWQCCIKTSINSPTIHYVQARRDIFGVLGESYPSGNRSIDARSNRTLNHYENRVVSVAIVMDNVADIIKHMR